VVNLLWGSQEIKIFHVNITAEHFIYSLLAIPAFLPATVCTGYLAAWFTNLHNFWSVPLSLAVSTIASVLIGKVLSLAAVVVFFLASGLLTLAMLSREWLQLRRAGRKWTIGWHPLGGKALFFAIAWIVVVIVSLVDFESNRQLFMNSAFFDQAPRVNWTESVLRTGVPPTNSLYLYKHPAPMRYYYFWYVVCASVARMAHLPARDVFVASCVWAGFVLVSLIGLYLKHFVIAGVRLRQQFLVCTFLLTVTGLDICVNVGNILFFHRPAPGYLAVWPLGQITGWFVSLLWDPHHVVSLVCCMTAFLLAWMAGKEGEHRPTASMALIALALASAFGLSIYVTFAFFLLMLVWALWQVVIERTPRPALTLAAGGAGAIVLLLPYLWELMHSASKMEGGSLFSFAVREMIPPDGLLSSRLFQHLAAGHPLAALNIAKLVLLAPGYAVELGFYFLVFLIYLVPAWRGRTALTPAQRSLVFISVASIPLLSLVRSGVLVSNDFGWRAALPLQFSLLLLASELITRWRLADRTGLPHNTPHWLRSIAALALVIGVYSTLYQALLMRFSGPLVVAAHKRAVHDPVAGNLSHDAYISYLGYAQLDRVIPQDAVVQFNPVQPDEFWKGVDLAGVDHQAAMGFDKPWCGSEFGGDPSGCPAMAAAIDPLFNGATAEQARATCHQYGVQYLVASIYDPAWKDKSDWVWTLSPVVSDEEFRALDCRQ
jgi:hypothetical protein